MPEVDRVDRTRRHLGSVLSEAGTSRLIEPLLSLLCRVTAMFDNV